MELTTRASTMFLQVGTSTPGGQQLRGGQNGGGGCLQLLKMAQMGTPDGPLFRCDATDIVGMLLNKVSVEIVQRPAHLVGMLLVHTKNDGFGEAIRHPRSVGRIGKLDPEDLCILFGLLEAVPCRSVVRLRLNHGDREVTGIAKQVIRPLLGAPPDYIA